jgi:hypothetical protein
MLSSLKALNVSCAASGVGDARNRREVVVIVEIL